MYMASKPRFESYHAPSSVCSEKVRCVLLYKGPSINDVTHERGEGVVQNVIEALIGCVNGTVISGGGGSKM